MYISIDKYRMNEGGGEDGTRIEKDWKDVIVRYSTVFHPNPKRWEE
jgi:hypothetical protein